MFRFPFLLAAGCLIGLGYAVAQTGGSPAAAPPSSDTAKSAGAGQSGPPSYRYRFSHVEDGVLRLDNETGKVAICKPQNGSWTCKEMPERTSALEADLGRLKEQNLALQSQIEAAQKLAVKVEERDALNKKIVALQIENEGLKGRVDTLKDQVTMLEGVMSAQAQRDAQKNELAEQKAANAALSAQLAALRTRTDALENQLAAALADAAAARHPEPAQSDGFKDLEQARVMVADAWRRMVEMIVNLQKDMMRKS
jgi:hypothetical protein